jgi:protein-tyrosine-phosphatase
MSPKAAVPAPVAADFFFKLKAPFIPPHRSYRSHIPEAILRSAADDLIKVASADSKPAVYVHPKLIELMREIGIDLSRHHSKHLEEFF